MKKIIALIVTLLFSVYGVSQIYKVANEGCITVESKNGVQSLSCGLEGYMQGFAWICLGLTLGLLIWFSKTTYKKVRTKKGARI